MTADGDDATAGRVQHDDPRLPARQWLLEPLSGR